jgi:hypothetical protein
MSTIEIDEFPHARIILIMINTTSTNGRSDGRLTTAQCLH